MKVSKAFLRDFALVANHYQWTPADIEEVKTTTRANPDLLQYWSVLAAALRAGYRQTPENNFIRLRDWHIQQGMSDPFRTAHRTGTALELESAADCCT